MSYLHAICLKILGRFDEAQERYNSYGNARVQVRNLQYKNLITSLILLPLQKQREKIEDILSDVLEIYTVFNPLYGLDHRVTVNLAKIEQERSKSPKLYYNYLG